MGEEDRRIGALEAWRESHHEEIRQIQRTLTEMNRRIGQLLDRDAARRGFLSVFGGLPAATWAAIGGGAASLLVSYILHGGPSF